LFIHSRGFVAPARAREGGSEARSDFEPFGVNSLDLEAEIRRGTQRDAVKFSLGANNDHGLRRTNEDKHRAVLRAFEDAEWKTWTDGAIAELCAVSQAFVSSLRRASPQNDFDVRRKGLDGKEYSSPRASASRSVVDGMALEEEREAE
jgi:hypothetical protein